MNWFQQNRWLGTFLIVFGLCFLVVAYFLFSAKSSFNEASARFNEAAAEKSQLERRDPFPSEANYRKMKTYLEDYSAAHAKLKEDLTTRALPAPPLAPNEFQSRLRQAMLTVSEKARVNKVKLPDNFALGFDEFTAALPNTAAAPLLGQQLSQVELLMNILVDARVDGISALVRAPLPEERGIAPAAKPGPAGRKPPVAAPSGPKVVERSHVDVIFASTPSAARKVLNQIASSQQQLYIIRILHVRNEKDKGPAREQVGATATATPPPATVPPQAAGAKPPVASALSFIVGNEHIETSARIELIRFAF